jgi:hypothetical protein
MSKKGFKMSVIVSDGVGLSVHVPWCSSYLSYEEAIECLGRNKTLKNCSPDCQLGVVLPMESWTTSDASKGDETC